jgi:hypothetical protein
VDVGRGGDETILATRDGWAVSLKSNRSRNTMEVVGLAQAEPGRVIVDVVGVGAGVYDRLREVGTRPLAYTGSGKTGARDRSGKLGFVNVRSAAYWHLRELLDPSFEPVIALPPDNLMISDLTTPRWAVVTGVPAKIQVEQKDKVVERLGRSPDRGDAIAMSLWADRHKTGSDTFAEPVGHFPTTGLSPIGRH